MLVGYLWFVIIAWCVLSLFRFNCGNLGNRGVPVREDDDDVTPLNTNHYATPSRWIAKKKKKRPKKRRKEYKNITTD